MPEGAGLPPLPCHQVDVDEGALDMGMNGDFNSKMRRIQSRKAHETKLLWNNRLLHFIKVLKNYYYYYYYYLRGYFR